MADDKKDPRFYNPDGKEITLTDEVEFEEVIRLFKETNKEDELA